MRHIICRISAIETGAANMARHLGIIREFGLNPVVAVNRFPGDTDEEVELVKRLALEGGAYGAELNDRPSRNTLSTASKDTAEYSRLGISDSGVLE